MAFLPHVVNGAQAAADPTLRSQLDTATQLRRRVFIDEQKVPEDLEWDGQDLIATTTHAWLTDGSGQVVALGRVLQDVPNDPCVVHIGRVAVDSSLRGTGVGRQIMALLERVGADVASTAAPQASACCTGAGGGVLSCLGLRVNRWHHLYGCGYPPPGHAQGGAVLNRHRASDRVTTHSN